MKPSFPLLLSVLAVVAACTSPPPLDLSPRNRAWPDTGTAPSPVALERVPRYYVDESGAIWDDRGRKLEKLQGPL